MIYMLLERNAYDSIAFFSQCIVQYMKLSMVDAKVFQALLDTSSSSNCLYVKASQPK